MKIVVIFIVKIWFLYSPSCGEMKFCLSSKAEATAGTVTRLGKWGNLVVSPPYGFGFGKVCQETQEQNRQL